MSSQPPPVQASPQLHNGPTFGPRADANVDMEANGGRSDAPAHTNLDHEYSIPSTVKFTWLGTYFLLSLMLTIYNKLVLGVVCPISTTSLSRASFNC